MIGFQEQPYTMIRLPYPLPPLIHHHNHHHHPSQIHTEYLALRRQFGPAKCGVEGEKRRRSEAVLRRIMLQGCPTVFPSRVQTSILSSDTLRLPVSAIF